MIDNNNKPKNEPSSKFCSRCVQPLCYKQHLRICKKCKEPYEQGKYRVHIANKHHKPSNKGNRDIKYWGFQVNLD